MAITLITKNSVVGSKRPTAAQLVTGELGLNAEASDPGLYFEDSAGNIRKVGGCSYGSTAPNASAAGQAGNSVGELWYDTGAGSLKLWDGSAWSIASGSASQFDWQSAAGAPTVTTRADGSALADGDLYWDQTADKLYGWDTTTSAWVPIGGSGAAAQFDWQAAAGAPTATTRSDGSALVDGDQYWDQTADKLYGWNAATSAWALIGPSGAASGSDAQATATAPSVRSDGSALQAGDLWYDTTNELLSVYDGSVFEPPIAGVDVQAAAAAPTTRSNGKTLVEGDLYYDTATDAIYAWDGAAWVKSAPQFDWQATAGSPIALSTATRSGGGALVEGDQAWDSVGDQLHIWDGLSWGLTGQNKVIVTATSLTANPGEYIVVTAATQTITLPASPKAGDDLLIVISGTFLDTVVAQNGNNIMGLAQDLTINIAYAAMRFTYTGDATEGWRVN